jgi:hypothetical protein
MQHPKTATAVKKKPAPETSPLKDNGGDQVKLALGQKKSLANKSHTTPLAKWIEDAAEEGNIGGG